MAIYKENIVDIDLTSGNIHRSFAHRAIGTGDNKADHIGVRVYRGKDAVDLTGVVVQGIFLPPQGDPIAITSGNIVTGNTAVVVLPQACYNYEGPFCLAIKLVSSGEGITGTVRIVDGMVDNTHTNGTVAPTETVPTYQEILAVYEDMQDALEDVGDALEELDEYKTAINPARSVQFLCGQIWRFDFSTMKITVPASTDVLIDGKNAGTISSGDITLTQDGSGRKQLIVLNRSTKAISLKAVSNTALDDGLTVIGNMYIGTSYRFNNIHFVPCELEVLNGNYEENEFMKDIHLEPKECVCTKNADHTYLVFTYSTRVFLDRRLVNTIAAGTKMNITPTDEYEVQTLVYNTTSNTVKINNAQSLLDHDDYFIGYFVQSETRFVLPFEVIPLNLPHIESRNIIALGEEAYRGAIANLAECGLVISLMTDTHYQGYSTAITKAVDSLAVLNYINNQPLVDMCVNMGDLITVTEATTHDMAVGYVAEAMGRIRSEKLRSLIGNHEINAKHKNDQDQTDYAEQLSKQEQYMLLCKCAGNKTGKCYWYEDIEDAKVRVYFADNYEYAQGERQYFSQDQIDFLSDTVIGQLPQGYKILMFIHSGNVEASGNFGSDVAPIIADNADKFIAIVHGHVHTDKIEDFTVDSVETGIPYICINSTYRNVQNLLDPLLNTVDMLTVTLLGISKDHETIYLNRIGYGVDNSGDPDYDFRREIERDY